MALLNKDGYPSRTDIPQEDDSQTIQEASQLDLHEFTLEMIDEALTRGITLKELRDEVQSEVLRHTPVRGKTLFDQ